MYIKRITSMNIPFSFTTAHAKAEEKALLDSGAMENFIDKETWKRKGVGKRPLVKPIKVYNVDGTENSQGDMTHFCRLRIMYNSTEDLQNFYITNLGKDQLILGYPFLHRFNPKVNWWQGTLEGGQVQIQSTIFKHLDKLVTHWQAKALKELGKPKEGDAIYVRKMTLSQEMEKEYWKKGMPEIPSIPREYQKYEKVFSKEDARKFPPDWNPNATVEFLPGAPDQLNCKVYPLTRQETEILKKFLSEELDKGFIEEAALPYTSPVFFINKKGSDEKRLIIDYRRLNEWTKRDNGPL
jgi:hypothetical protein